MITPRPDTTFPLSTSSKAVVTFTGHVFLSKSDHRGNLVTNSTILLTRRDLDTMRRVIAEADRQTALWDAENL